MTGQGVFAGQVVHVHADGTQTILSPATFTSGAFTPSSIDFGPASDQVFLVLYGTGLRHAGSVVMTVNGVNVPVLYFGAQGQFAGLDQINISLPRSLAGAGAVSIVATVDGVAANMVTAAIQ